MSTYLLQHERHNGKRYVRVTTTGGTTRAYFFAMKDAKAFCEAQA